ncbi:MAG: reactive intermediate/imine deaminase [Bacteroidetes bacterium]|nr:MAG: reactive intermediate/imine deaminase [Bacteroidota bacterium]
MYSILQKTISAMTFKCNFNTSKIVRTSTAFPQAVITDNYIFLSGTPGIDPNTGKVVSEDFEDQLRQSFHNVQTVLQEAHSDLSKIVKTTIFMVTGNDFGIVNKIYSEFFPENAPARSTPQVMPFPAGMLVSVECIALV